MGLTLILSLILVIVVVMLFSWMISSLLKKDKKDYLSKRAYDLHPPKWNFLDALDRLYAKHF